MTLTKRLLLTAALVLLAAASADARPRLFGRRAQPCQTCQPAQPAPVQPQYRQSAPAVVLPQVSALTLPAAPVRGLIQTVGGCVGGICPAR